MGDIFGYSVASSAGAKTTLIGERDVAEAANLYSRTEEEWNPENPIALPTPAPGGPMTLSADGTTVLIGMANQEDGRLTSVGTAHVYRRTDVGWDTTDLVQLPDPDPAEDDRFGDSVALSTEGDTALVGAPGDGTDGDEGGGAAYLFERLC